MFGNSRISGDRKVTKERVYPSSCIPPLRLLARRFPQTAPIVVSLFLRVIGSLGHSPASYNPTKQKEEDGGVPSPLQCQSQSFSWRLRVLSNNRLDQESHTFFGLFCFSFMEGGKRIRLFWIVDDFFP